MATRGSAQGGFDFGNAWYNPSQTYLKLSVWEDGVYRVDAASLSAAGLNVPSADVPRLQLWYRGKQQYIHVETNSGNLSFVEFYGRRNDGKVDSSMYRNPNNYNIHDPNQQPMERLSLYTDTSAYYLSIGPSNGLRVSTFNDQNYGNYIPEPYFRYETYHEYHPLSGSNQVGWNSGGGSTYEIYHGLNSYFITGEGYMGTGFGYNANLGIPISTPHPANAGTSAEFSCRIFGRSTWEHVLTVSLDGNQVIHDTISGIYIKTRTAQYTQPLGNTLNVVYNALGNQNNNTDNNNYCWSAIRYDRLFDIDGAAEIKMVDWQQGSNAYFRFTGAATTNNVYAWDLTNNQRSVGRGAPGYIMDVVVPGAANVRDFHVVGDSGIRTPLIETPELTNLSDPGVGAEFVIITHSSLLTSANAYKNYRDTCSVNQLSAKVVTIDQIYDEFGYGSITPLAIKRFCKYAIDNWQVKPKFFLLWGKGQYETRLKPLNLVPTFGDPACDYEYVSDYDNMAVNLVPEVPIGRVNVYNDDDGFTYLDKVNEYEHTDWASWMKHTVFLGGGNDTSEQNPILYFLRDSFKPFVEGAPFGGVGNYYQKFNTGLVTNSNLTSTQRINEGASIIHFFGHSNSNIYDVDIQEPVLYQNFGKYPLMIAFGCYGGNFTGNAKSFGERFVLEPGRGSIGYLANSTAGYLLPLGNFGDVFYSHMYGNEYGQPIGEIIKESIRDYYSRWSDMVYINHSKQMNLQGDPSIVIYAPQLPDLSISEPDVYFSPDGFSASDSSFDINIITHNLGRVTQDSFYLSIRQLVPGSGNWITYPKTKHPPILNVDTLQYTIYNTMGSAMAGLNTFDIFVDSTNLLAEFNENNNRIQFSHVIPGNSPAILSPYDYAVVPSNSVKLAASSYILGNQAVVRYQYEIDTVPEFNSSLHTVSPVINGTSAYSEWQIPFSLQDSTVYYWRVRLADLYPVSWAKASFKHIVTKRGWAQSRPPQFFQDPTERIEMNETSREWEFDSYAAELSAYVANYSHAVYRLANGAFFSVLPPTTTLNGLMVTPIRQRDLIPTIQNTNVGDWAYLAMPGGSGDLISKIATLESGDYLLVVSENDARVAQWPQQMTDALQSIGVDVARLKARGPGDAFIILARKGFPSQTIQIDQPNVYDAQQNVWRYDLRVALNTNYDNGNAASTTIGPATYWNELIWDWYTQERFGGDDVRVSLYASPDGIQDSLVYDDLTLGTYNLNAIDAQQYPFMRLKAWSKDTTQLSAPQLEHWHVLFTPAPDALIEPTVDWAFDQDSMMLGQQGSVDFTVRNVSDFDMDSLLVKFAIRRADRSRVELGSKRYGPLAAWQTQLLHFDFSIAAQGLSGDVAFMIEINPDDDQPELHHFNNRYDYPFYIRDDGVQPIMDVTVDGKHLMNGDIISPTPEILIEINDENPFLAINDTAYEIYFGPKSPNPNNLPRVFIGGNSQMESIPANLPANKARLYFRPGQLADGEYTLRVQGYDYAGNAAGKDAYEINFLVVNESALSNVLNYPNPFSTSTRFVYTLTGAEVPEVFQIHIFTITGRLIKIVDLHETNDVRVGYNITEYTWDGRDEFGDLLANGVYIYKVVAKSNGEAMKHREEGVSQLFNNGFGKMYIMR